VPILYSDSPVRLTLPDFYTPQGKLVYATGHSTDVPPNTEIDIARFQRDMAALSPDGRVRPVSGFGMLRNFRAGYVPSFVAGIEQSLGDMRFSASYVGTAGVSLPAMAFPNSYDGAGPGFAPYTQFDSAGQFAAGYGQIITMSNWSHSTFHSLQTSASKSSARLGLSFQASYTFGKSIDDTSAVLGGFSSSSSGMVLQTSAQNPRDWRAEKGPSVFDVTHVFSLSAFQDLPMMRLPLLRAAPRKAVTGWQLMSVTTLMTGMPFTVFSGIQQTGAGFNSADRPDQIGTPSLSTSRTIREDYFGLGANNASYFSIPIHIPGGTGPNEGRFGTLGRNTFRGPGMHNFDLALIKDTLIGRRANAELLTLQFRGEFFNAFNIVNFGLPSNIVLGTGFGTINRTATPSRQIQLSLKLLY
jgi:hypothetical protein